MRPSSKPLISVDPQNRPRSRFARTRTRTLTTRALAVLAAFALTGPACERQSAAPSPPSNADIDTDAPAIAWQEWQRDSFARAATERKLILVTVVAGWCHWCHVMDEKTYTDAAIRTLLGRHYISIRVDADARPDLAERYAEWGWPAIAVLTPDARPVLELRGYQEAAEFALLLRELAESEAAGTLKGRRSPPKKKPSAKNTSLSTLRDQVKAQLDSTYDSDEEGWGHRQKYPLAGPIEHALLRSRLRPEDELWAKRALATLENELKLVDPVWGGMYQYSLYGVWTRPHYEKIAKVQVGALLSFALAYRRSGDPRWLAAGDTELRYLQDHLVSKTGGFYSAQDADLRDDTRTILGDQYYAKGDAERRALGIPGVDMRIYADLNGDFIRALCSLDAVDGRPPGERSVALEMAIAAAEHLLTNHRRDDATFRHEAGVDDTKIYLRDQAAVGRGLLALYQATGEQRWLGHATQLADRILSDLVDREHGSFFAHSKDPEAVGIFAERRRPLEENGETARFLIELERLLDHKGEPLPYIAAAEAALLDLADPAAIKREGRMVSSYLLALEELLFTSVDITIVAADKDARARLLAAARAADEPRKTVDVSPPGERYPDIKRAAAYICSESACSTPISDPAELGERLRVFTAELDRDN